MDEDSLIEAANIYYGEDTTTDDFEIKIWDESDYEISEAKHIKTGDTWTPTDIPGKWSVSRN